MLLPLNRGGAAGNQCDLYRCDFAVNDGYLNRSRPGHDPVQKRDLKLIMTGSKSQPQNSIGRRGQFGINDREVFV